MLHPSFGGAGRRILVSRQSLGVMHMRCVASPLGMPVAQDAAGIVREPVRTAAERSAASGAGNGGGHAGLAVSRGKRANAAIFWGVAAFADPLVEIGVEATAIRLLADGRALPVVRSRCGASTRCSCS